MLEGKIVVVSGIGPGIGRDISLGCAREGADIVLAARTSSKLDRLATSEEIAEAVLFFASDRSRAITGQSLDVNCGSFFA
jgi:NAD(P)-dependent dehydrogenase (short-subunit alcohol dehydrogenase family)